MRIYVASSWRNEARQQQCVLHLRAEGHEVYDFRRPAPGNEGFSWRNVTEEPERMRDPTHYRRVLEHPIAVEGFCLDMDALRACEACVLVLPCGRSAHWELGWAAGATKRCLVWLDDPVSEPELMYRGCDPRPWTEHAYAGTTLGLCLTLDEVVSRLSGDMR